MFNYGKRYQERLPCGYILLIALPVIDHSVGLWVGGDGGLKTSQNDENRVCSLHLGRFLVVITIKGVFGRWNVKIG